MKNRKNLISQYYRLIIHHQAQKFALAVKQGNEVKYPHQQNYLSEADLIQALEGGKTIGIMLAQDKTYLIKAGCIDIDIPRDAKNLTEGLALAKRCSETAFKLNLRGFIEYSGNRGFHLWIFANKPIYASLMQSVLKTLSYLADFEAKEIFPNSIPESKCIKLPCSIHLKTGNRCGFIDEDFNPNNPQINLESQAKLMAEFEQNSIEDLTAVANLTLENFSNNPQNNNFNNYLKSNYNNSKKNDYNSYQNSNQSNVDGYSLNSKSPVTSAETNQKLNSYEDNNFAQQTNQKLSLFGDNHPSCINFLLKKGSPLEIDYNQANLTLARYCISRDYNKEKAIALAESMAKNTSDNHPTSKDYQGKIANFRSAFNSASRKNYQFACGYVLAKIGNQPLSTRGCIGKECLACDWLEADTTTNQNNPFSIASNLENLERKQANLTINENNQSNPQIYGYNKLIFEAMRKLLDEGKEVCKSNILEIIENQEILEIKSTSESNYLKEAEILAYLINQPDNLTGYVDLPSIGFINGSSLKLSEYLDNLINLQLPSKDTIKTDIEQIKQRGLKTLANQEADEFKNSDTDLVIALDTTIEKFNKISKKVVSSDIQLELMSFHLEGLIDNLKSESKNFIPSFSTHLNNILNGGFMGGKLYVLGAPPGSGKSTICSQIADYASLLGIKVIYASYEMSREQLFINSLSRLGKINSALIEGRKFLDENKPELQLRFSQTLTEYQQNIADNQIIIEADSDYTPSRLKAIVKKTQVQLIIVDYLQLLSSGDIKLDNAYQETLRVSKIATELKRLARDTNTAVIAISDINKDSYLKAMSGNDLDMGALRDSFKIAHSADVILLLQSGKITTGKGDSKTSKDQLDLLAEKYPDKKREIDKLKDKYPLETKISDTYSRLTIVKNRGGKLGEPCFKYSKALHNFQPLDFNIQFDNNEEVI